MLTLSHKQQLVEKFELCNKLSDIEVRNLIVSELPPNWRANLERSTKLRQDLVYIVEQCISFGGSNGISTLIDSVKFHEGESLAIKEVERFWQEILSLPKDIRAAEPEAIGKQDTKLAQELHWNRDQIVETFIGMITKDPAYMPWRVLALEGPPEAGLNTFIGRLDWICKQLPERIELQQPLLHARIGFKAEQLLSPHQIVKKITNTLVAKILVSKRNQIPANLFQAYSTVELKLDELQKLVEKNWEGAHVQPSKTELAKNLDISLEDASQQCAIVLLFEDFDKLNEECRSWFLDTWLMRYTVNLENIVLVIVGKSGLSHLKNRDDFTICFPVLPIMDTRQLLKWAHSFGLKDITIEQIEELNKYIQGNPTEFYKFLYWTAQTNMVPLPECVKDDLKIPRRS